MLVLGFERFTAKDQHAVLRLLDMCTGVDNEQQSPGEYPQGKRDQTHPGKAE